jgi:putative ABC transport system permease protein
VRNGWRKKDVVIVGMDRHSELQTLMDSDFRTVDLGESGLVLSSALAETLNVGVGDQVELKPLMGKITREKRVPVSKIVEQYFGMSGYMNIEALSRVLDEAYALNAVLVRADAGKARLLHEQLKDVPIVSAVEMREDAYRKLQETIATSMRIMSVMSVIFAGVIAFAVIYNVTLVSLAERERELASLRVLGFSRSEVGRILFNENFVTGAIGLLLGVPMGISMVFGMKNAFSTDLFRFPFYIAPQTYVMAMSMTVGYIVIANLAVRLKISRLDLVETLKARE